MASKEHIALSDKIKSTHRLLRDEAKQLGAEEAWRKHCLKTDHLEEYARTMQELAVTHWDASAMRSNSQAVSRNTWIHDYCKLYFFSMELLKQRDKEIEIADRIEIELDGGLMFKFKERLELLDVGSCYNPFRQYGMFNVCAIDIAPANENVFKCDFLRVPITDGGKEPDDGTFGLRRDSFDVVVFSLLLEYLPCAKQRLSCCQRAYDLLKFEGLLIIVTPDSKHAGANAQIIKSWRYVLSKMGFSRIKYEKLPYIHCMAFRKCLDRKITQRWVDLHKDGQVYDDIFIPQDFRKESAEEVIEVDD